jgi:apolipoprotein D and lipocalin family protein
MKKVLYMFVMISISSCSSAKFVRDGFPPLVSIGKIDITRYTGKWYEIARFPFYFEDGLVNTTATYTLLADGRIRVLNEGYRDSQAGKKETAEGIAWVSNEERNAELKVSFFGPFSSDYWIIELDKNDYSYAMVCSGYKYLWILSRTPVLDRTIYKALTDKAAELGFETTKLYEVPQVW